MDATAWIQRAVSLHLTDDEQLLSTVQSSPQCASFLQDINKNAVLVSLKEGSPQSLAFTLDLDQLDNVASKSKSLVISKAHPAIVTADNVKETLNVLPLFGSDILKSFHHAIKLFAPALARNNKIQTKLRNLISDLDDGIGASIQTLSSSTQQLPEEKDTALIFTLADEISYWHKRTLPPASNTQKERASFFSEELKKLQDSLSKLDASSKVYFDDLIEVIEEGQDVFDEIWKQGDHAPPYPEQRMANTLRNFSDMIIGCIQNKLSSYNLITDDTPDVASHLNSAVSTCHKVKVMVSLLTQQYWPQFTPHKWTSGPLQTADVLNKMNQRLQEVIVVHDTRSHYCAFLTEKERRDLSFDEVFDNFKGDAILLESLFFAQEWKNALAKFQTALERVDGQVAAKLKNLFATLSDQPSQIIIELKKFHNLLERPTIRQHLSAEQDVLRSYLNTEIKRIESALSSDPDKERAFTASYPGKNLSVECCGILWARQSIAKVTEARDLLKGWLHFSDPLFQLCVSVLSTLSTVERDSINAWNRATERSLAQQNGGLKQSGKLMELDYKTGQLRVNFGDSLVTLLREVRQVIALGLPVTGRIQSVAEDAHRFYRHGVVLQQVAHFYNTIDQQMLPSQQALLLGLALAFEKLVKSPGKGNSSATESLAITWEAPKDLEKYVHDLSEAADKLSTENRRLRSIHTRVCIMISELFNADLLKQQQKWKETLMSVRSLISSAQNERIPYESTLSWRIHWDYQLLKALDYQYQQCMDDAIDNLPEIRAELAMKSGKLIFKPAFEEIRFKLYKDLKKFISLPLSFKGFADNSALFASVTKGKGSLYFYIYEKVEDTLQALQRATSVFDEWAGFGGIDLEELVNSALISVDDYEFNFKSLKLKGKEVENLPAVIKVRCFTISTAPIKAVIDDLLQNVFDTFLSSLRKKISGHLAVVDAFISSGTELLTNRPTSMEEVGTANHAYVELSSKKEVVSQELTAAEAKNRLLKVVAGVGLDLSSVQNRFDKLDMLLKSFQLVVREQLGVLQGAIEGKLVALQASLDKFAARWAQLKPPMNDIGPTTDVKSAVAFVREKMTEFAELQMTFQSILQDFTYFELPAPVLKGLDEVETDLKRSAECWELLDQFSAAIAAFGKEDWISFRSKTHSFEEMLEYWAGKAKSPDYAAMRVYIDHEVDSLRQIMPILKYVRGDSWMPEHWGEFFLIASIPKGVSLADLTFGHLLDSKETILRCAVDIKGLNDRANGEVALRQALQELEVWSSSSVFSLLDTTDSLGNPIKLIRDWKECFTQLGDNQSLLQSLKDSPYFGPFADKVQLWEVKLIELDECLRNVNTVQRKWVYLEPIFSRGSLPSEQPRFSRVDTDFRQILQSLALDARIFSILKFPNLRQNLMTYVDQLERCQKALNEYLELKRSRFARFYFIGDEDLLEILGQAKNPMVIQAHLKKLFAGVHNVMFNNEVTAITGMKSVHGEIVQLKSPVPVSDNVEQWLEAFTKEMKRTLHLILLDALRSKDYLKTPSQILDLAEYIHFTKQAEEAIAKGDFASMEESLKEQLNAYVNYDLAEIKDETQRQVVELKLKSLMMDSIHYLDVVTSMANVHSTKSWEWQRQIRFYVEHDVCIARMHDSQFHYTYEYQGIAPKLVHTTLTDKCYLTLTQAISNGFGGNPFGPAGTGKTESVKALGVLLGRQVLVFNCDEGIDYKSMGRIFTGIVKCGAWGCFDEFNRLESAVLSSVSQQIQVIQTGLKISSKSISILGKEIELDLNSGVFVTLNPAGKGYGGRQELPDNLKQLFRSVAMTHPNNDVISQVILYSEGFSAAKNLGKKVVAIFVLSKQLLSPQQHYEWGLRPLKAVLSLAGSLLKSRQRDPNNALELSESDEAAILVQALRINTISKLTSEDEVKFNLLIKDVFTGVQFSNVEYATLGEAVKSAYAELNLLYSQTQVEKIFQLYEACRQRIGVVIVGPSGSGKSTILKILLIAWRKIGQQIKTCIVNPKAIERVTLLGKMDLDTREWTDGIITSASRQAVKEPLEVNTWMIFDGDIDPEWVESLNSVLDDNRLLTIPNGDRIRFGANVNFIFETSDLRFASPATVSRMGMIYLSEDMLDLSMVLKSWATKQNEKTTTPLLTWIQECFYPILDWSLKNAEFAVTSTKLGLVWNALSHADQPKSKVHFVLGILTGITANMTMESKTKCYSEMLRISGVSLPNMTQPYDHYCNEDGKVYRYSANLPEGKEAAKMQDDSSSALPVIETISLRRNVTAIMPWLKRGQSFLLSGPDGCGRDTTLRYCFAKLSSHLAVATVNCSTQTKALHIIQRIKQLCTTATVNGQRVLKPKEKEFLALYVKDINLPKPDKYATVEAVQFLQQIIAFGGFWDANMEWTALQGIFVVASMNPTTSSGRNALSSRFTSIIRLTTMGFPEGEELRSIYAAYSKIVLTHKFAARSTSSKGLAEEETQQVAQFMVAVYDRLSKTFNPAQQAHYIFTPRHITKWIMALMDYEFVISSLKESLGTVLDILAYEALRLFEDCFTSDKEKSAFRTLLTQSAQLIWSQFIPLITNTDSTTHSYCYEEVEAAQQGKLPVKKLVKQSWEDYREKVICEISIIERDIKILNIPQSTEAIQRISNIQKILGKDGSALLAATRPGSQTASFVFLASHMLGIRLFTPSITRAYTIKQFFIDLKEIVAACGVRDEPLVFLMETHQFIEPAYLECVNSLLAGGEVAGLFSGEEMDTMINSIKEAYEDEGKRRGCNTAYEFLLFRLRRNLRIVLLLDCGATDFVLKCESNPALYTCCQIQWLAEWTQGSLFDILRDTMNKVDSAESDSPSKTDSSAKAKAAAELLRIDGLPTLLIQLHNSCVKSGATSKHFFDLLLTYKNIYSEKKTSMQGKLHYLESGLRKLTEATNYVDKLSADAKIAEVQLEKKRKEADASLKQITEAMLQASEQKTEMEALTIKLVNEEKVLTTRKVEIERQLSEVEPIIRQAKEAVGEIKMESISEIRSLRAPPPAIRDVLEGVLRLMGAQDMSWNSMKTFLGKRTVKEEIVNFDVRNITKEIRKSVQALLDEKADSFDEAAIKRASVAAAPLAMWIKANLKYSTVAEKIAPLEKEFKTLETNLESSKTRVATLKANLSEVDQRVGALKETFSKTTAEAEVLKAGLESASRTMKDSTVLLEKLSGEGTRWSAQVAEIQAILKKQPLSTLMASAFVTYLGSRDEEMRSVVLQSWRQSLGLAKASDAAFSLLNEITTETNLLTWKGEGLPSDVLSNENAATIINSVSTPMIIDPSGRALEWLKTHLASKKPEIVKQSDDSFMRVLELAVRFGKTLIVRGVDSIEPVLYTILVRDLVKQGPRLFLQLGDKSIDFNESFNLFLVTDNPDFRLPSHAAGLVNEVNFTITRAGLAGQLLSMTLTVERPDLEEKKKELLRQQDELKLQLAKLEDSLLTALASSEGNILENKALLASLTETKTKSITIERGLAESNKIQAGLDKERERFSTLSTFGSSLYFAFQKARNLNNMYCFSLASFYQLYNKILMLEKNTSKDETEIAAHLRRLRGSLERRAYAYYSRAMFKEDRISFAIHVIRICHPELFEANEWEMFSEQLIADDDTFANLESLVPWLPKERTPSVSLIQKFLPNLFSKLQLKDTHAWAEWMANTTCEAAIPPFQSDIKLFENVLIIQAFRPDRIMSAVSNFCCKVYSVPSMNLPSINLKRIWQEETSSVEPILLLTTPGADPSKELEALAVKELGAAKYHQIPMGQGQGDIALQKVAECASAGHWLCLQNIHLVLSWLPSLLKALDSLKDANPDFRIWLTTEAHRQFRPDMLEKCLKITFQAPPGIKKNLQRIYENFSEEFIADGSVLRSQALFHLAWFHSVIQERRTYIPQGWTKFYEYNQSDLRSGADIITKLCQKSDSPDWTVLHGLLENAVYGGRVDDYNDGRRLRTFLQMFFDSASFESKSASSRMWNPSFNVPRSKERKQFVQLINDLPESDDPDSLNLPKNIDGDLQRIGLRNLVAHLRSLRQTEESMNRFDKDKWAAVLTPFLLVWKSLNTGNDLLTKSAAPPGTVNAEDPVVSFLQLEVSKGLGLIRQIHKDLSNVSKVIRSNNILPTAETTIIAESIIKGVSPPPWMSNWEGSESCGSYIKDVVRNALNVISLLDKAVQSAHLKSPIVLPSIYNPIAFLNALRQVTSRQAGIPMDSLKLFTVWRETELRDIKVTAPITGLYLQGCRFDGNVILDNKASDPGFSSVPTCYLAWLPDSTPMTGKILVPLYTSPTRETLVTYLQMPCLDNGAKWLLYSAAFFLSTA